MLAAIVLTGAGAEDAKDDPAQEFWAGCRAVDWCVQAMLHAEAKAVTTLGGRGYGFAYVNERAPERPMEGLLAAVESLKAGGSDSALIIRVGAPAILPSDLQPLLLRRGGAVFQGLDLPMLLPFRAIPDDIAPEWSFEQLAQEAGLAKVYLPPRSRLRLKGDYTAEEKQAVIAAMPR